MRYPFSMSKSKSPGIIPDEALVNKIFLLRNQKVMLDWDLAELYGVKAIRLREQVKKMLKDSRRILCFSLLKKKQKSWYRKTRYHQRNV